ncbi:MAG: AI-2E family transporter [Pseudobdellovibrionaceae bacterium]
MINQKTQRTILQSFFLLIATGFFLITLSPFWMAILMACIFAMGIEKSLDKIRKKLNYEVKINAVSFFVFAFLCVFLPLGFFVLRSVQSVQNIARNGIENTQVYQSFNSLKQTFLEKVTQFSNPEWGLGQQIEDIITKTTNAGSSLILETTTGWLGALPDLLVGYFIFLLCLYAMLKHKKAVRVFFLKLQAFNMSESDELIEIIKNACYSTLISSILIGFIQAFTVSMASLIFSAGDFWLVLMITFCLSFIPAIGAAPVAFALSLPFFLGGSYFSAIGLCIVGVIAGTIDNLLRPILVGSDQEVNPLLLFLASIGGILIFGIPGLFIGPVATIVFMKSFPLLMENLLESRHK